MAQLVGSLPVHRPLGFLPSITQTRAGGTHLEPQNYRGGNRLKDGDLKNYRGGNRIMT